MTADAYLAQLRQVRLSLLADALAPHTALL